MKPSTLAACLLSCAWLLGACSEAATAPAPSATAAPVPVRTIEVRTQALERELLAVGTLRADESVTVRPEIAGRIVEIGFAEGQAVQRGQLLFALDDSIDRAQLEQARATQLLAQRSARRADELHDRKLVSSAERDQAHANLALAAAQLAVAEARVAKMRILAPFNGVAGLRSVSPGDYVGAGQDLARLEAMETMKIDFRVDQSVLPALRVGQSVAIRVDAITDERFSGEVYAIEPRVADTTRSVALRARIANPDGRLRPGQFAQVRLMLERDDDAVVIPERALFPRGAQQFVYVVRDGRAELREVHVGQRRPGQAEIVSGLQAGERLIVSGIQRVNDGVAVDARAAGEES